MIPYTPPLDDIRFVLDRLIGFERLSALPAYESVSGDLVEAVLGEAGKIAAGIFAPLNEIGDRIGAKFENGKMIMPSGFRDAYQAFVDGGWNGLPVETEHGGQGLPWLLAMAVQEMAQAANIGLALCPLLNQGAIELLSVHGDAALKQKYLPKLVSGIWTGTMNLTEPQAGSDVGAVQTKAVPVGAEQSRRYKIFGQKIYISYGDHDMSENILHFVLARLPDAPQGTRGLSLFLVPKILVNEDGALGAANDLRVVSIEHKLGQHSSPTCVMAYGDSQGAIGYLVGTENGGINAMFTMMNNARIGVGIQGLGLMERATQYAEDYAKNRVQSRPIENAKAAPVTINKHPDVQRMLLSMRAQTGAARALAYHCGFAVDVAKHGADETQRDLAAARVDLLTPIVKSWLTDLANEVASTAVQVFGGMGYIEETGAAQFMRDARVLAIYEGTNGIQGNDLLFRKLARDDGAEFFRLAKEIEYFLSHELSCDRNEDMPATGLPARRGENQIKLFNNLSAQLSSALAAAKDAAEWLLQNAKTNPALAAASASPFLRLCGAMLGGYYLIRSANLAQRDKLNGIGDDEFNQSKIIHAHFYALHILPQCAALAVTVRHGAQATLDGLASLG